MNPVDHVSEPAVEAENVLTDDLNSLTVVVTINISARLQPSQDMLRKVKKLVSLLLAAQVCYVVPRR